MPKWDRSQNPNSHNRCWRNAIPGLLSVWLSFSHFGCSTPAFRNDAGLSTASTDNKAWIDDQVKSLIDGTVEAKDLAFLALLERWKDYSQADNSHLRASLRDSNSAYAGQLVKRLDIRQALGVDLFALLPEIDRDIASAKTEADWMAIVRSAASLPTGERLSGRCSDTVLRALSRHVSVDAIGESLISLIVDLKLVSAHGLLEMSLRSEVPRIRESALAALASLRIHHSQTLMVDKLRDPDGMVRGGAALALAQFGDRKYSQQISTLLVDEDHSAREAAIGALQLLNAREAAALIAPLMGDEEPAVRSAAARAVGILDFKPAAAELRKLCSDFAPSVRVSAIQALLTFRDAHCVRLFDSLLKDPERVVRAEAFEALVLLKRDLESHYILLSTDDDDYVRARVVRSLSTYGTASKSVLVKGLRDDSALVYRETIRAILRTGTLMTPAPGDLQSLDEAMSRRDTIARTVGRIALGQEGRDVLLKLASELHLHSEPSVKADWAWVVCALLARDMDAQAFNELFGTECRRKRNMGLVKVLSMSPDSSNAPFGTRGSPSLAPMTCYSMLEEVGRQEGVAIAVSDDKWTLRPYSEALQSWTKVLSRK